MSIFEFNFENWYSLNVKLNWLAVIIASVAIFLLSLIWGKVRKYVGKKSISVDEVTLGIGTSKVTLKYNSKGKEIAYKLWVELSTRKLGLPFDSENDVIVEVYNSWYQFFAVARELLKELPAEQFEGSRELIDLTQKILNKGLRPHLTKWQAKFRFWEKAYTPNGEDTPQMIQRNYPDYEELEKDLLETNRKLIYYKELMQSIAFNER